MRIISANFTKLSINIWAIDMKDQEKIVLQELLNYFDGKNIDLEVWKIKASLIIKKIFGPNDDKLHLIEDLHYDYSSWSLRDKTGVRQADTVVEQAKGIIEAALLELSLHSNQSALLDLLEENLTGAKFKALQNKLAKSEVSESEIVEFFSKIAGTTKDDILAQLLLTQKE